MSSKNSGVRCTASGRERTWERAAWTAGHGLCPDCGAEVDVWVRGTDLAPRAKARAHRAPQGVEPREYGVDGRAGHALPKDVELYERQRTRGSGIAE
jgi:hypothetical protein